MNINTINDQHDGNEFFTPREDQILKLIILEYTTSETARMLYISKETVRTHRKHLLDKFKARNVAGLVRRTFEYEYLSL